MEKIKYILTIIFALIFVSACGGIGTETGNPEIPNPGVENGMHANDGTYTNSILSFEYDNDWNIQEAYINNSDCPDCQAAETGGYREPNYIIFSLNSTSVTIETKKLVEEPDDLETYLTDEYPDTEFEEYSNGALDGYKMKESDEYFFINDLTLLHITTETIGSGSSGVDTILWSINFVE